jgi:hypothetical protein
MFNNYQYRLTKDKQAIDYSVIIGLPTFATIPNDTRNRDWQAYQAWLAEGNIPLPGDYRYISDGEGGYKEDQVIRLPDNTTIFIFETEQWNIYQTWLSYGNKTLKPI